MNTLPNSENMLGIKSNPLFMDNNLEHISDRNFQSEFYFNEQTSSIFENVFAFYGILDSKGRVLQLKGTIFEQTNLDTDLLVGQKFSETVFWQSSEITAQLLEKAIEETASGIKSKIFLDFRLSSEDKRFVELYLQPSSNRDFQEIFFCAQDITVKEKEVEYYKQRSEQLLYAAESAEIGLWSWDLKTGLVYSTPRCNELFETSPYDLLNYDSFMQVVYPEDRQRVEEVLGHSQQTGSEYNEQFRVIYSDARIEWVSARGKTFLDAEGNPEKMMGVVRKITEQKVAEKELSKIYDREKQARDEAVEANRAKDFFLAFVSHELRSPLNAILGWSKILLTKKVDEEMQKNALETIERSARSQAKLINDLVDSARIASGKLRLEFLPVNLFEIVRTVYNSQKPLADSKEIKFELIADREEVPIFGDINRLQQVFNNLVTNALKFTPNGGNITLNIKTLNQSAKVLITDSGQGIDANILPNIFRQFSQGEDGTIADKGGLGLGLSIVKILVEKHNGTVAAESKGSGKGSTFTVSLPLTSEAIPSETEESEHNTDEKPLRGVNILLIEDDNDSREVLSLFLTQCGAVVTSAESAKTAMEILVQCDVIQPDIIISDLAMPIEDGYSLIARIRQLPDQNCSQIPAIALSAFATNENKQRAFQAGFQKYSTKPFEPDLLIEEILSLVKK